jgi:hypothetical protein
LGAPLYGERPLFCTIYISETKMKTLDLHGLFHSSVEKSVENFVLLNETPLKIITGNSNRMKELVFQILEKYDFSYYPENYVNFGAFVVINK